MHIQEVHKRYTNEHAFSKITDSALPSLYVYSSNSILSDNDGTGELETGIYPHPPRNRNALPHDIGTKLLVLDCSVARVRIPTTVLCPTWYLPNGYPPTLLLGSVKYQKNVCNSPLIRKTLNSYFNQELHRRKRISEDIHHINWSGFIGSL